MNYLLCCLLVSLTFFAAPPAGAAISYTDLRYKGRMPLWFDVLGTGIELKPLQLEWDLSDPRVLVVGDIRLAAKSIVVMRGQPRALFQNPDWMPSTSFGLWDDEAIILQWPLGLFEEGIIEAISRSGRTVFTGSFDKSDADLWAPLAQGPQGRMTIAIRNLKGRARELGDYVNPFRFCISSAGVESSARLCTAYMRWSVEGNQTFPELLEIESRRVRVIINQSEVEAKGILPVDNKKVVSFYAQSTEGISYEFFARPKNFELTEAYEKENGNIAIVSPGSRPSAASITIRKYVEGQISQYLWWISTIGDFREFWEAEVPKSFPVLYIPGEGAGVFRQEFKVGKLPKEDQRIFLDKDTPFSTYVDGTRLYLTGLRGAKPKTKQNSVSLWSKDEASWYFRAKKRGQLNSAKIEFETEKGPVFGQFDLYKGYPGEVSARLGFQYGTTGDLILLGEGAVSYWYENLFGWNNYWLGRHRWGTSYRYTRTLTEFKIKESSEVDGIQQENIRQGILAAQSLDVKYRLSPGLWGRDETWGLILGVDLLRYSDFDSNRLGLGVLWARSMPKVFDELFNLLPLMTYPKFVDAELIVYPTLISSPNVSIANGSPNFNLNFHGKVLWKPWLFGEAGFGLRSLSLRRDYSGSETDTGKELKYFALHGTVGLGVNF